MTGVEHAPAKPGESRRRDAATGKSVLFENVGKCHRRAGRAVGFAPGRRSEGARDGFDFDARHGFGRVERRRGDRAVAEETLRHADATDRERLETFWLEAAADDELGGTAADVDDEPRVFGTRKLVGDAKEGQPSFFVPADDVDGQAQRALGERDEFLGVAGDAERIRRDHAHGRGLQSGEAFAESGEAGERGIHRGALEPALVVEPGAETQRLAPGVELVDLVALDAADFEPEAVRTEIEDGQKRVRSAFAHEAESELHGERSRLAENGPRSRSRMLRLRPL